MRNLFFAFLLVVPVLLGQASQQQRPSSLDSSPQNIGADFLAASSNLALDDLSSVYLAKEFKTAHNGVTHLVYRQRFHGIDVSNSAWVVNIGADDAVLNSGGTLYATPGPINVGSQISADTAVRAAVREVNPRLAAKYARDLVPKATASRRTIPGMVDSVRYAAGDFGPDIEGKLVWFAHRGSLLLSWMFNVVDEDGVSSYDVAVEAATGAIINKQVTTFFQATAKGMVFDKGSPQPTLTPGIRLTSAPPLVDRTVMPFDGDPLASPLGWVINNETAGYNAVVGENLLGLSFLATPTLTRVAGGDFSFPLLLGPSAPNPLNYRDAANVNLFYWINRAHDLFYKYGFDEVAGNFQSSNYGRGGLGGDAVRAFTHYGSSATVGPALNNAFFDVRSLNDGATSQIGMYATTTGTGGFFEDGAYAADTIIHEYTHGVSLRLLPDGYGSFQTAAMGEAWSDFFALEFTTPDGSPVDGSYPIGEYWNQSWGTGIRTRPFSTNTNVNPLTYADLGHVIYLGPEVHADGEIWVQALWEARANLIRQFGESEGRRRIRQLVIDGLKLSPPSPSMVDARDAILLADRVDYEGSNQSQLWSAFAKRGLGALAHSDGGDTTHIISSFDLPSSTGKLKFYEDSFVAGEPVRVLLSDTNLSQPAVLVQLTTTAGDVEDLTLRRSGSIYYGFIPSSNNVVTLQNGFINLIPGDILTVTYNEADPGLFFGHGPNSSIQATAATQQPYALFTSTATGLPTFPNEIRLTSARSPVPFNIGFDFPFFSKKYRSMVVFPTGAVVFEPSAFTSLLGPGCNDTFELSRIAAIAPLFAQLTIGTAQAGEGVFASVSSNSVSIRWSAETLPTTPLISPAIPEPVNFAVTLTSDGTITFYYGAGNENLQTAAQTLTTCGSQPTVGISNGHDVYTRTVSLRTYDNASSLSFAPAFGSTVGPEVILERPAPNETVRDVMRVSGIAYNPAGGSLTALSRRDVYIDDVQRAVAAPVARPDFCSTNPVSGCPTVGFQSELNLATLGLAPGRHTVRVRVSNTRGAFKDTASVSFNVDAATARLPKGAIEVPAAGTEVSGTAVEFRGYAYAQDLRVSRVDLLIDGVTYPGFTGAVYGLSRPDICSGLPAPAPPNCPAVGWTVIVNTLSGSPPLPDGQHLMQLRVLDESGRYTLLPEQPVPFRVKNGPQSLPVGAVTSIKPNDRLSGIVTVSGYAYSTVGQVAAGGVALLVDGSALAIAQYGQSRPVECASLSGVAACPNIGFSINLDTRTLTNGSHVIGVRITNSAGLSVTVPNLDRNGMNVIVDNR